VITVTRIAELRQFLAGVRADGGRIGLVPTMGSLHDGHLALCDAARRHSDVVVLSIFVNPLQFAAGEDLDRYPRDLAADTALAAGRGVGVLFAPAVDEIYPTGTTAVTVMAPALAGRLCGAYRPGHFDGVLTVVAKLFNIVMPHVALFGQKDLQQATLIRRMAADLDFPVAVRIEPIVREHDGLAMSSRNVYLTSDERVSALSLSRALRAAQDAFAAGERSPAVLTATVRAILERQSGVSVQYVELVDVDTLESPARAAVGHAVAIAVHVGSTRLIDNHLLY
jgi:pantoate--beta-alanine ligase